jgi:5'-nucleotidase
MKRLLPLTALLALAGCASSAGTPSAPFAVKIIGFNDYHGNLQSPGSFSVNLAVPAAQRTPVGGAEYIAAHVNKLRPEPHHGGAT